MAEKNKISQPQRWDEPFDPQLTDKEVGQFLKIPPFLEMDAAAFRDSVPLTGILKNDCRLHRLKRGDIIVREGDYGSSAFLILSGQALVSLKKLPDSILGRKSNKPGGWGKTIAQIWKNSWYSESRDYSKTSESSTGSRTDPSGPRVFLHDIPRVIQSNESVTLEAGEIFGEISALTRTPRSSTVVAHSDMQVLEIRWQGFRELLQRQSGLRQHIERLYRENSLELHLRESDLLCTLPADSISRIADCAQFQTFGDFQWNQKFKSTKSRDISERILSEPLIVKQGDYINGLILIRSGFARLSRQHGDGHQTIAYLGKGQMVGLRELAHNWKSGEQRPWLLTLRAVGYVDVLTIPTADVESQILPHLKPDQLPDPLPSSDSERAPRNRRLSQRDESLDRGLMEFLVEKRFVNGTQAMVIDLDRCTRCDDCLRACAQTHDNNPRFNRSGKKHDHWMVANACMHCLDPVCMIGCPTGAIGREQETGFVTINDATCIGCSTCANSCPYDNIRMVEINDRRGTPMVDQDSGLPIVKATKCDFCVDQLGGPACQRACPHEALVRIDLTTTDAMTQWVK